MLEKNNFLMSFSKILMMKVVKQGSLTMTFKSLILFSWLVVVFPPKLPCMFLSVVPPGRVAAVWVLGSEVGGNLPAAGVSWLGFYFLFPGLCFSVPCH